MLYQISMFWDGCQRVSAVADSAEHEDGGAFWVTVKAKDAAKTTIFVADREKAERLAALINELAGDQQAQEVA